MARASASCRYRMGNVAELLRGTTALVDRRPRLRALRGITTLVVVRPFLDAAARPVIAWCRSRGVRLVADFDDLLYAGDPAEYPLVRCGALTQQACAGRIERYRTGLREFDAFTVATEPLRDELTAVAPGARVGVVPNGLSPQWVRQGRALYRPWQPGDAKVIRFLPGSPSHDADFATIAPALRRFVAAHPEVSLEVVGPLDPAAHGLGGAQVRRAAAVPFAELPRYLASSWVTLAPLADTAFTRCKSAIKFLESAAFGAPCIASPAPDMKRHARGGVLLVEGGHCWIEALEGLLDDSSRMSLGRQGRHYVDRYGMARDGVDALGRFLESW